MALHTAMAMLSFRFWLSGLRREVQLGCTATLALLRLTFPGCTMASIVRLTLSCRPLSTKAEFQDLSKKVCKMDGHHLP